MSRDYDGVSDEVKAIVLNKLPKWFRAEPGFRFLYGKEEAIVVGWGTYNKYNHIGSISITGNEPFYHNLINVEVPPSTLIIGYIHNGRWTITAAVDPIKEWELEVQDGLDAKAYPFPYKELTTEKDAPTCPSCHAETSVDTGQKVCTNYECKLFVITDAAKPSRKTGPADQYVLDRVSTVKARIEAREMLCRVTDYLEVPDDAKLVKTVDGEHYVEARIFLPKR